ncbi:hypothetical protein BZG36_03718 [Bifiguratus adelaidae]|uniref:gamma-glutamylcyclotransferase n=1 Tax=Bifiguratus adelaidae TaxID=1938954 RepID=A0A261XZ25_9FUNG|nr:hypothetical protein BZG36_03718 [Bifiguratus adelaidae]
MVSEGADELLVTRVPSPLYRSKEAKVQGQVEEKDTGWYLAYGPNMSSKVLTGRRQIKQIESRPCECPNVYLSFEIVGPAYMEPCFASAIIKSDSQKITEEYARHLWSHCSCFSYKFEYNAANPSASLPPHLHGVVHKLTKAQHQQIKNTEGGVGHDIKTGYSDAIVRCVCYDGSIVHAHTLIARPKYLEILRSSAKEHGISPKYQDYLASLKHYEVKTLGQKIGHFIFLATIAPWVVIPFFLILRFYHKKGKQVPFCLARYLEEATLMAHAYYQFILRPLFGNDVLEDIQSAERDRWDISGLDQFLDSESLGHIGRGNTTVSLQDVNTKNLLIDLERISKGARSFSVPSNSVAPSTTHAATDHAQPQKGHLPKAKLHASVYALVQDYFRTERTITTTKDVVQDSANLLKQLSDDVQRLQHDIDAAPVS